MGTMTDDDVDGLLGKEKEPWPDPLDPAALHGLAGDIVRTIEPHTEADPVALLIQTLVAFGNAAGRNAYYQVEADRHYSNIYAILVGRTSKARKGTAKSQVLSVMESADAYWTKNCVQSGLSSGEGLIWAVRDPIEKQEPIKDKGRVIDYQSVIVDSGIEDKRLLAIQSEFASTLRVMDRDGNTLSTVIRDAWDTGNLGTMVKHAPARSTGAHISIVGHITIEELLRDLDNTEAANGFANRFLWACVCRSKCLPLGGHIEEEDFDNIVRRLKQALDHARKAGRLEWDPESLQSWKTVYAELSEGQPGLLGAMTARAEAQVVRLALLYALLDCSTTIRQPHLTAALALWEYCEQSVAAIFGDRLGNPIADVILPALRSTSPNGLTRTQISGLFNRHVKATQIDQALKLLSKKGKIRCQSVESEGRWPEMWFAV
jgi:hypothetical protein